MPLIKNRGNRIGASNKSLVFRFTATTLLAVFCTAMLLLNARQLMRTDWHTYHFIQNGSVQFSITPYFLFTMIFAGLVCLVTACLKQFLKGQIPWRLDGLT